MSPAVGAYAGDPSAGVLRPVKRCARGVDAGGRPAPRCRRARCAAGRCSRPRCVRRTEGRGPAPSPGSARRTRRARPSARRGPSACCIAIRLCAWRDLVVGEARHEVALLDEARVERQQVALAAVEVARPHAEANGGLGAALGADHAGGAGAGALAERVRLDEDDALEPVLPEEPGAPGADRFLRRPPRRRPCAARRRCWSQRRRWHRLNSQSRAPLARERRRVPCTDCPRQTSTSRRRPAPSPTS